MGNSFEKIPGSWNWKHLIIWILIFLAIDFVLYRVYEENKTTEKDINQNSQPKSEAILNPDSVISNLKIEDLQIDSTPVYIKNDNKLKPNSIDSGSIGRDSTVETKKEKKK